MPEDPIVVINEVEKSFRVGKQDIPVIRGISLTVHKGNFLIVFGASGSGKSTLLHTMIGLEKPTEGTVHFHDTNLYDLTEDERADFRKANLGMVYQQSNWIKSLSVVNNVAFPLLMMGEKRAHAFEVALEKLTLFQMQTFATYYPTELSAGQQQRVSLARALVANPTLIIADEPTGNLDFESGQHLVLTLADLAAQGHTIVMVTHDLEHLGLGNRAIQIRDGKIAQEYGREELRTLSDSMALRGMSALSAGKETIKVAKKISRAVPKK